VLIDKIFSNVSSDICASTDEMFVCFVTILLTNNRVISWFGEINKN